MGIKFSIERIGNQGEHNSSVDLVAILKIEILLISALALLLISALLSYEKKKQT